MAKEVEWSNAAYRDRQDIYQYWLHRSGSHSFGRKLEALFIESANLISEFPEIGSRTEVPNVRVKVIRTFKLFYIVYPDRIRNCASMGYSSRPGFGYY